MPTTDTQQPLIFTIFGKFRKLLPIYSEYDQICYLFYKY